MNILDIHQHLSLQPTYGLLELEKDYDVRVREMDKHGIEKAVISTVEVFNRPRGLEDTKRINDLIAEYVVKYGDRFPIGLGTIDPLYGEKGLDEIDRAIMELKFKGFCWSPRLLGAFTDHPMMIEFVRKLAEHDQPALIHAYSESMQEEPWRLQRLAEACPDVHIVAVAALWYWSRIEQIMDIMKRCPNIGIDTCVAPVTMVIERVVNDVGAERLYFGSDIYPALNTPTFHHCHQLVELQQSPLVSDEEKELILFRNAKRLFGLE